MPSPFALDIKAFPSNAHVRIVNKIIMICFFYARKSTTKFREDGGRKVHVVQSFVKMEVKKVHVVQHFMKMEARNAHFYYSKSSSMWNLMIE